MSEGPPESGNPLHGRSALVTGASRGIGRAAALALAGAGARLYVTARGGPDLDRTAADSGGVAIAADLTDRPALEDLVREIERVLGGAPDVLVNAAGVFELSPAHETDPDAFDRHLALNAVAPFRLVRALLPAMLDRGDGNLIHIGSVAGRRGFPENAAYSASKFALRGMHEVLVLELMDTGVRSTLIEPSAVDTAVWDPFEERLGRDLPPRGAMLSPETVGAAVVRAAAAGTSAPASIALGDAAGRDDAARTGSSTAF